MDYFYVVSFKQVATPTQITPSCICHVIVSPECILFWSYCFKVLRVYTQRIAA